MQATYVLDTHMNRLSPSGEAINSYRLYRTLHPIVDMIVENLGYKSRLYKKQTIQGEEELCTQIVLLETKWSIYITNTLAETIADIFSKHTDNSRSIQLPEESRIFTRKNSDGQINIVEAKHADIVFYEIADKD